MNTFKRFGEEFISSNQEISEKKITGTIKPKRGQANKRERVRTENVNAGFDNLRKLIPTDPADRKLSKIEVLRLATSYINHLYNLTRANSCLEAEANERALETSSDDDNEIISLGNGTRIRKQGKIDEITNTTSKNLNKSNKHHICTFCLMMTKTKASSVSTKRK